jgi:hypothetical protein
VQKAIDLLDAKPRGSWCLVRAYDEQPELSLYQQRHQARNKDLDKSEREAFVPPMDNVSPDCGYILFKDSKIVIFYSNDLDGMPSEAILDDSNEEAIRICRGLSSIHRWTGNKILTRSTFQVPAPIVGYNMFMNGID